MAKIYCGGRTVETEVIQERAARAATGLETLGVGAGDTIATFLRNDLPHLEASFAARKLGAYVTPINWHNSAGETRYILADSGAKALVIHADLLPQVAEGVPQGVAVLVVETPPAILADYAIDPARAAPPAGAKLWSDFLEGFAPLPPRAVAAPGSVIYTSGTTGRPKGVRKIPNPDAQAAAAAAAELNRTVYGLVGWEHRMDQVVMEVAGPIYHAGPNGWSLYFTEAGASLVLDTRFDPERTLANIERHRVTHLQMVPTMFVRLLKLPPAVRAKYDLSSLAFVIHGAAPCPPHVKQAMIDWWGPILFETYGSSEVGSLTACTSQDWLSHPGAVGRAMADAEIRILAPDGAELAPGEIGEIVVRRRTAGDFTYHGDEDKRRAAARGDGFVSLGDMGFLDRDGFLYLSGRASDMVISGGVNIYPAEIEAELLKMPGVVDCAVFGIPDEEFGEQLCAYVQPQPGVTLEAAEVTGFIRQRLAAYKAPRRVEFAAELPREDSGKIFKRKLREPFWQGLGRQL